MGIIENIRSYRIGQSKGRRAVELSQEFMELHANNPPQDLAKRFFISLGDEVNDENPWERKGANKVFVAWRDRWCAEHPVDDRTFKFPHEFSFEEKLLTMMGFQYVEVDPSIFESEDPAAALRDAVLQDAINRDPLAAAAIEQAKADNLAAGKCLGCGGGIDAEGLCDGTPPEDGFGNPDGGQN